MPFTWFDMLLALVLIWSAMSGLRAGFARVIVGIGATVVGFLAGFWFYRILSVRLMLLGKNPSRSKRAGIPHHLHREC